MGRSIIITGARTFIYINGKRFGRCTSLSISSATPNKPIETVDSPIPVELAPTRQRTQVQLGLLRTEGDGGIEGRGMAPRGEQLPRGQYFSLAVTDRVTDTEIFRSDYCMVDNQNWQVQAKGRWEGSASISCLTWNNEIKPKG